MTKINSHVKKFQDPWVTLWQDDVEFDSKRKTHYGYIELKDGVHAVVVDKNNKIVIFKEYEYPVKKRIWSIPGGGIEKNETPEEAIKREIKEEVGLKVISLKKLGGIWHLLAAFLSSKNYLFLAFVDGLPINAGVGNESISNVQSFSTDEILKMIDNGEIESCHVANALQIAIRAITRTPKT